MFKQYFILFAFLMFRTSVVLSAPPIRDIGGSASETSAHINYISRTLPFSIRNDSDILQSQRAIVSLLRSHFPKYDDWIAQKTNPHALDVYEKSVSYQPKIELADEALNEARASVREIFERELKQMPPFHSSKEKMSWLKHHGLLQFNSILTESNNESIRGLTVGLAQVLQGEEKRRFFKLGNSEDQLLFLEQKGITDEMLRKSQFRAEQFGFSRETVTVESIFNLIRSKLDRSKEIFAWLSYLKVLSLVPATDFRFQSEKIVGQLRATDFDFAYKSNSEFLQNLTQALLNRHGLNENQFQNKMLNFQANISRLLFTSTQQEVETRTLVARLYEVPPHLAIYRGCVGGDCSTTRSAFYPYSPWEHVFYIMNERNEFVGYASVTKVKSKGVDTFYLKDLNGAKLSPEVARAALFALREATPLYGAKRFAIASPQFTNAQNSNRPVREMLSQYNSSTNTVPLEFLDAEIRSILRHKAIMPYQTAAIYDDPQSHELGVLLNPREPDSYRYFFSIKEGSLPEYSSKEIAAEFLRVVAELSLRGHNTKGISKILTDSEVQEAAKVVLNNNAMTSQGYFRALKTLFRKYSLPIDRSFMAQNEELFARGIFKASDVLVIDHPWKAVALKKFIEFIDQGVHLNDVQDFFARWKNDLLGSPEYKLAVDKMKGRLSPQDVFLLFGFAEQESKLAQSVIRNPLYRPQIEAALEAVLNGQEAFEYLEKKSSSKRGFKVGLGALKFDLENTSKLKRSELKLKIAKLLKEFRMKQSDIKSANVQNRMDVAFLLAKDAFGTDYKKEHRILQRKIDQKQLSRIDFLNIINSLEPEYPKVRAHVKTRLAQLLKTKSQEDILEIQILLSFKSVDAANVLSSMQVSSEVEQLLKIILSKEITDFQSSGLSKESYELWKYLDSHRSKGLFYINDLRKHLITDDWDTAESLYKKLSSWFQEFGARPEFVFSLPATIKIISEKWLAKEDAFTAKDPAITKISLEYLTYLVRAGRDDLKCWKNLMKEHRFIRQSIDYQIFVESIKKGFIQGNCRGCARAVAMLTLQDDIPMDFSKNLRAISHFLQSDLASVKAFGLMMAAENQNLEGIHEALILDVIRELSAGFIELPPTAQIKLKEGALRALKQTASDRGAIRLALLDYISNEPINIYALNAAEIFISHGGDARRALKALTVNYPRKELEAGISKQETAIYQKLKMDRGLESSVGIKKCEVSFNRTR